jgi:sigma-B regulation protein RsbU (phosphoserine phosphatase)
MAEISISTPAGPIERFALSNERVTIGRSRESDIFLPDQWLSRQHAEIQQRRDGFYLVDLGSKNGTLVNGTPVHGECRLHDGDVMALGEHVLTFLGRDPVEEEDEAAPEGTRIFSARELGDLSSAPAVNPEELARQNRLLVALTKAVSELIIHRPLGELLEKILHLLFEAVPAERGAILLVEGEPSGLVVKTARSRKGEPLTRVSRSITRLVLEGQSLLLPNVLEDARFQAEDSILSSGIRSAACVPLWLAGREGGDSVIGLVYLDSLQRTHSFGEDDLRLLTALANVAAAKIENVRLLEESLERQRLEEDMRVAAEIQRSLLPAEAPSVEGWGLSGLNVPCRTVGGDYYDFSVLDGQLLLALGDVSGKGTGAALLMTVLRAAVRSHWEEPSLAEAMGRINRTVVQNVPSNKYITFFMARLDPVSGRLSYVNAGHNPPLLVRQDGTVELLRTGGMVLGLLDPIHYEQDEVSLRAGDLLVVYSDGVTETWNDQDEEFGEEGLTNVAVTSRGLDPSSLQGEIIRAVDAFSGGPKATDDRTLLVLKRD